jgi:hypothetical protein
MFDIEADRINGCLGAGDRFANRSHIVNVDLYGP